MTTRSGIPINEIATPPTLREALRHILSFCDGYKAPEQIGCAVWDVIDALRAAYEATPEPTPPSVMVAARDVIANADTWRPIEDQTIEVTSWALYRLKEAVEATPEPVAAISTEELAVIARAHDHIVAERSWNVCTCGHDGSEHDLQNRCLRPGCDCTIFCTPRRPKTQPLTDADLAVLSRLAGGE